MTCPNCNTVHPPGEIDNPYWCIACLVLRVAELEALSIVQENLPVPALKRRIEELEARNRKLEEALVEIVGLKRDMQRRDDYLDSILT